MLYTGCGQNHATNITVPIAATSKHASSVTIFHRKGEPEDVIASCVSKRFQISQKFTDDPIIVIVARQYAFVPSRRELEMNP